MDVSGNMQDKLNLAVEVLAWAETVDVQCAFINLDPVHQYLF